VMLFLNALNDSALRIRVLDQQPKTLDDALSIVVRMESYSGDTHVDHVDDVVERKRVRVVSPVRESETDKRIKEFKNTLSVRMRKSRVSKCRRIVVQGSMSAPIERHLARCMVIQEGINMALPHGHRPLALTRPG